VRGAPIENDWGDSYNMPQIVGDKVGAPDTIDKIAKSGGRIKNRVFSTAPTTNMQPCSMTAI
jgi:hypothetical protein